MNLMSLRPLPFCPAFSIPASELRAGSWLRPSLMITIPYLMQLLIAARPGAVIWFTRAFIHVLWKELIDQYQLQRWL